MLFLTNNVPVCTQRKQNRKVCCYKLKIERRLCLLDLSAADFSRRGILAVNLSAYYLLSKVGFVHE